MNTSQYKFMLRVSTWKFACAGMNIFFIHRAPYVLYGIIGPPDRKLVNGSCNFNARSVPVHGHYFLRVFFFDGHDMSLTIKTGGKNPKSQEWNSSECDSRWSVIIPWCRDKSKYSRTQMTSENIKESVTRQCFYNIEMNTVADCLLSSRN